MQYALLLDILDPIEIENPERFNYKSEGVLKKHFFVKDLHK